MERREATLSRRILEDATFEALMIFDDARGLVSSHEMTVYPSFFFFFFFFCCD